MAETGAKAESVRIYEFEMGPELEWGPNSTITVEKWGSKISIDMKWVSGVKLGITEGCTDVLLAGSSQWFTVKSSYFDFVEKWKG